MEYDRYFLRGIKLLNGTGNNVIHIDILHVLNKIADNSEDIFLMPSIPPPKNKTGVYIEQCFHIQLVFLKESQIIDHTFMWVSVFKTIDYIL